MKFVFLFLSLFCSVSIFAQEGLFFPKAKLEMNDEIHSKSFLKSYFEEFSDAKFELQLKSEKRTRASVHFDYHLIYENMEVFNAGIKINTDINGKILSIKKDMPDLNVLNMFSVANAMDAWKGKDLNVFAANVLGYNSTIQKLRLMISTDEFAELVLVVEVWNKSKDFTYLIRQDGTIKNTFNNSRYLIKDTVVQATIFNPDPLTKLTQVYDAVHKDFGDSNKSWLLPAYESVSIPAYYDDVTQTFLAENDLVKIEDFETPTFAPATNTTDNFIFNRSESGFEDCNVMYHITKFHDYISSLGYDTLMDLQVRVDAHGMFGADNSQFNRNGGNPTLSFGPGGVDDAEDADVIIHEYCHGVSWSANANDNFTFERSGLDEGLADYFATSYSRGINTFNWTNMFSWDGHNEFWIGRIANTSNNYPTSGNIYSLGEIWNAAMSAIWTDLGQIITDKLMLESLHFFTNTTKVPEAALYVLQSDSILFNGIHTPTICNNFKLKNILGNDCWPVGIQEINPSNDIVIKNSLGFSSNNESLLVEFSIPNSGVYTITDVSGNKIYTEQFSNSNSLHISPSNFASGIYFLTVTLKNESKTFKLSKF